MEVYSERATYAADTAMRQEPLGRLALPGGRVVVRGSGYWETMVINMLAAKIKTKMIVSWWIVLSEPRRTVFTSPLPPRPAPKLAPRVWIKIRMMTSNTEKIVM